MRGLETILLASAVAGLSLLAVGCSEDPLGPTETPPPEGELCVSGATRACGCREPGGTSTATCSDDGSWGPCPCGGEGSGDGQQDASAETTGPATPGPSVVVMQPVTAAATVKSPNYRLSLTLGTPLPAARLEGENHHLILGTISPHP